MERQILPKFILVVMIVLLVIFLAEANRQVEEMRDARTTCVTWEVSS